MNDAVTMRPGTGASLGSIDQYELVRELGGGGFGCVYLARDTVAGIEVAVKGLPPLVRLNKEELENIRRNFALVSRLHHPNIAAALHLQKTVHAAYADKADAEKLRVFQGDTLVVMQFAPGVTLSQWRKQFPDGKVPFGQAIEISRQIASAIDYAHEEKILHRDIKPANVMIETAPDGKITARVLDFGLAAEIRSSMGRVSREITDTSGTRPYMAPEQWLGGTQGRETDQYALAVLFYELVTGEVPFASVFETGDPVIMINADKNEMPEIPREWPRSARVAMAKALAKKREERFSSSAEFVDALVGRGLRPRRGRWGLMAGLALFGAAVAGGAWYWDCQQKEEARIAAEAQAAEKAKREAAAEKARLAAEAQAAEKAKREAAAEKARLAAEAQAAEEAKREATAEKVRLAAETQAAAVVEAKRKAEAEKARLAAEAQAAAAAEAKRKAEAEKARLAAEAQAAAAAEAKRKAEAEKARLAAEAQAAAAAEAKRKAEAEKARQRALLDDLERRGYIPDETNNPRPAGTRGVLPLRDGSHIEMVWCPPGYFMMGSRTNSDGSETLHPVRITKGFWMGKYEVTESEWRIVTGSGGFGRKPKTDVSFEACEKFCGMFPPEYGVRVPSEAEWEYACRSGTQTEYSLGKRSDGMKIDGSQANVKAFWGVQDVGEYEEYANAWGLCDMHGNVREWCADVYRLYEKTDALTVDPLVKGESGFETQVVRGGFCRENLERCRCASRSAGKVDKYTGFRICCDKLP